MKKIDIDTKFIPKKMRQWADRLDADFWGNILDVLDEAKFQFSSVAEKIKAAERQIEIAQLKEYFNEKEQENEEK